MSTIEISGKPTLTVSRVDSLDGLRGIAALSVVFLHLFSTLRHSSFPELQLFDQLITDFERTPVGVFWAGNQAVYMFFIMSGFALTAMLERFTQGYSAYFLRRVIRLWAPAFITVVISVILYLLMRPGPNANFGVWFNHLFDRDIFLIDILANSLMIGEFDSSKVNFVIWSLVHEIRLSLIFPLLFLAARKYPFGWVIGLSIFGSVLALYSRSNGWVSDNKTSLLSSVIYQVFFVIGIFFYDKRMWLIGKMRAVPSTLNVLVFCFGVIIYANPIGSLYVSGLVGGAIIVAFALYPGNFSRFLCGKLAAWLGKISYSLYLIHAIILVNTFGFVENFDVLVLWALAFVPVTLAISYYFYKYVELPLSDLARRVAKKVEAIKLN